MEPVLFVGVAAVLATILICLVKLAFQVGQYDARITTLEERVNVRRLRS